jgi:hypothetical protein
MQIDGLFLDSVPHEFINRELVLEAVKQNGKALDFASAEFKNDREIVLEAVKSGYSLDLVPSTFQTDREIVLEAVKSGYSLDLVPLTFQTDREIVLEAVKSGYSLDLVPPTFQTDREIVLEAVKSGYSLNLVLPTFQTDHEIVLEAIKSGYSLDLVPSTFQTDHEIVLEAVKKDIKSLQFLPESFRIIYPTMNFIEIFIKKKILCKSNGIYRVPLFTCPRYKELSCDTCYEKTDIHQQMYKYINTKYSMQEKPMDDFKSFLRSVLFPRNMIETHPKMIFERILHGKQHSELIELYKEGISVKDVRDNMKAVLSIRSLPPPLKRMLEVSFDYIQTFKYVSFDVFIENYAKNLESVKTFKKEIIIVYTNGPSKSNFWFSLYFYSLCIANNVHCNVIDLEHLGTIDVSNKVLVLCDDIIYSGRQLCNIIASLNGFDVDIFLCVYASCKSVSFIQEKTGVRDIHMHKDIDMSSKAYCNTRDVFREIEYFYQTKKGENRVFSSLRPDNDKQTKIIAWNKYADHVSIPESICFVDFHDIEAAYYYDL